MLANIPEIQAVPPLGVEQTLARSVERRVVGEEVPRDAGAAKVVVVVGKVLVIVRRVHFDNVVYSSVNLRKIVEVFTFHQVLFFYKCYLIRKIYEWNSPNM